VAACSLWGNKQDYWFLQTSEAIQLYSIRYPVLVLIYSSGCDQRTPRAMLPSVSHYLDYAWLASKEDIAQEHSRYFGRHCLLQCQLTPTSRASGSAAITDLHGPDNSQLIHESKQVGKIGDIRVIFDGHRCLSRKRCKISRWILWNGILGFNVPLDKVYGHFRDGGILWNVNRKSWVPD